MQLNWTEIRGKAHSLYHREIEMDLEKLSMHFSDLAVLNEAAGALLRRCADNEIGHEVLEAGGKS